MKVICLLSGGLDSSTLLADLLANGNEVRTLSVYYGQSHAVQELGASVMIAAHYDVSHEVIRLPESLMRGSALTGGGAIPEGHYADPTMKATVVPNRNMTLLTIAGTVAVRNGFDAVAYAAHAGDHSIYPDCRPHFVSAIEDALARCDYKPIRLLTPFLHRDKTGIVKRGAELGVPFELTYSCYKGGERHCGRCGTCYERKEAFQRAGVVDPTEYEEVD